eukprot:gnl/TRDRNA2_/TRDRNA2_175279_c3_seq1.p1 gnl/TRDRNA2_/TRDRNA2_175279_c3~~gnl/TRDRNA2_/TRDRNA2_175279_c3_seq1.p1  ORF type:complete len:334 (+),score=86.06 gnl/TRDRNA2_/TRDRNA2_175279_c3_seq1:125-1003(+)
MSNATTVLKQRASISMTKDLGLSDNMLFKGGNGREELLYVWTLEKFLRRLEAMREVYQQGSDVGDGFKSTRRKMMKAAYNPFREMRYGDIQLLADEAMDAETEILKVAGLEDELTQAQQELERMKARAEAAEKELEQLKATGTVTGSRPGSPCKISRGIEELEELRSTAYQSPVKAQLKADPRKPPAAVDSVERNLRDFTRELVAQRYDSMQDNIEKKRMLDILSDIEREVGACNTEILDSLDVILGAAKFKMQKAAVASENLSTLRVALRQLRVTIEQNSTSQQTIRRKKV